MKIIVVDDYKPIRDFMANALTYCVNREVLTFENGAKAWIYLENQNSFDIVVSDVDMPEMDGLELLSKIKNHYPNKICILMSGDHSNEKSAKELGADAFLAKPFRIKDLFKLVEAFVVGDNYN